MKKLATPLICTRMKILKKQNKPPKDIVMLFDKTMVLFFGDKAYQTAGQATTPKYRSQWIKRVLKWVMKTVDKIETAPRQKQLLMANVESAYKSVGNTDQHPSWELTYYLLALTAGYRGSVITEGPSHTQCPTGNRTHSGTLPPYSRGLRPKTATSTKNKML